MWRKALAPVVLGGVLLVCALWLRQRGTVEERPNRDETTASSPLQTPGSVTDGDAVADRGDVTREPTTIDLRDVSQTFRNSTLLFAIRRAGFYCADVVSALEGAQGVWLASCSDPIGYIVTLRGAEQFDVHPIGYIDSVAPVPVDRDRPLDPGSLAPQPLRK
jgi:hypothetical protein